MGGVQKFLSKTKRGFQLMTIEPALLLHMTASFLGNLITTDMQVYQACTVNFNLPPAYCKVNGTKDDQVEELTHDINVWKQVLDNTFPILYVLFLGAWSDIYGRKFPILMTIFGYIVRYAGLLILVYIETASAEWVAVTNSLPISLSGGRTAISMALYSYIADTTTLQDRTIRMGVLTAVRIFGKSAGSALGGLLKRRDYSYTFIFAVGGGMDVVAFAWVMFMVRNTRKDSEGRHKEFTKIVKDICDMRNIKESAKAFFRPREGKGRMQLILLVVVLICTMAPMQGEEANLQLFAYSDKIGWTTADIGFYRTYTMLTAFFGGIFAMGLLIKICGLKDATLGIVACCSQIAGSAIYSFADKDNIWMMYLAPAVDVLNGSMIIASRSMISKIVQMSEIGKVNSFVGTFDSLTPLPANPIYAAILRKTKNSNPGTIYYLSIALTIPPLLIFGWFLCNPVVPPPPEQKKQKQIEDSSVSSEVSVNDIGYGSEDSVVKNT